MSLFSRIFRRKAKPTPPPVPVRPMSARASYAPPVRNNSDDLTDPLHPLSPFNPISPVSIYRSSPAPEPERYHCPAPAPSYEPSTSERCSASDWSSGSSSSDSGSSGSDSGSSGSWD